MQSTEINPRLSLVQHRLEQNQSLVTLEEAVRNGLMKQDGKTLPCHFFYDEKGSLLFEKITELEEYYPTKCEFQILKQQVSEIARHFSFDDETIVVELGSGSSTKTRAILEAFLDKQNSLTYVPIEISQSILMDSSRVLLEDYENLSILANNGLYQQGLSYMSQQYADRSKLICFLGSSIGNFTRPEAVDFLSSIRKTMSNKDRVLIGIDLKKDKQTLELAYDDNQGVTAEFNLNLLERINKELGGNFDLNKFEHVALYNEEEGRIEMRIRSTEDQQVWIEKIRENIHFAEGETIHTENSYKYSCRDIDWLASAAGFSIEKMWLDQSGKFSLSIFSPSDVDTTITSKAIKEEMENAWKFSDRVFELIKTESMLERPISLRHPFLFYLGHLAAFGHNHICNNTLRIQSFHPYFDEIFERGIDPNVDDPTKCHSHSVVPSDWPSVEEVRNYKEEVRRRILNGISDVLKQNKNFMAQKGRLFSMTAEHDYMHAETLLYMYHNLADQHKLKPSQEIANYQFGKCPIPKGKMISIPKGMASIGGNFHEQRWGWDNEFPLIQVSVPAFAIDELPVTNGEFLQFVQSGEYENPKHWNSSDWKWKESVGLKFPNFWERTDGEWYYRTVFDKLPLSQVYDWPVYVSQAEASAFAAWKGKRLPTEGEFMRAAYGRVEPAGNGSNAKYPWGEESPTPGIHGNFGFHSWAPTPVGSFPKGKSGFGVYELIGNGWEWTCTPFDGLKGFEAYIPNYSGYSQDFFDGEHYVMLGASWATASPLIRSSFRNWFQSHYQYMFSKFRCVTEINSVPRK